MRVRLHMLHDALKTLSFIPPMVPALAAEPPEGEGWSHEIKYDGYRTEIVIEAHNAHAFTRNGYDWTERYRPVVDAARRLHCRSAILDGEMIVQDPHGRSDFGALRNAITHHPSRLIFYAFDLLAFDDRDLRPRPLIDRRVCLAELLGDPDPASPIQFSAHVIGHGAAMFESADAMGLEGIVSKKLGSRYRSGRTTAWLKIKCFAEGEFVVVGIERGDGAPTALVARQISGDLEYAGNAMVTLAEPERELFWTEMEHLKRDAPALPMRKRSGVQWVTPAVRLRVRYLKGSDKLRHATVRRLVI
jgi:bifunctional non-homologous end joining protein LigD